MPASKYKKKPASRNKRRLIIVLAILVLLAFLGSVAFHNLRETPAPTSVPTPEEIKQDSDINAEDKKDSTSTDNSGVKGDSPATSPTPVPPSASSLTLTAKQETNGSVTIATKLPGISSGTCTLTASNGSKNVTKFAAVIFQPEFSTCAGFSIPLSDLGVGTWTINVDVTYNNTSISKATTLEVH